MSNAEQPGRWPAVSYESLPWDRESITQASRATRRRSRGPYRSSIPIVIQARQVQLPAATTAAAEDAATEVARFDAELGHEIAPFATVLLRSESAASSKIENLTASARAIAEAELHTHAGRNATLIVANQRAMTAAIALAEHIDADAILASVAKTGRLLVVDEIQILEQRIGRPGEPLRPASHLRRHRGDVVA